MFSGGKKIFVGKILVDHKRLKVKHSMDFTVQKVVQLKVVSKNSDEKVGSFRGGIESGHSEGWLISVYNCWVCLGSDF